MLVQSKVYENDLSGAQALPHTDFPGIGRVAYCEDGQGSVFGIITSENGDI